MTWDAAILEKSILPHLINSHIEIQNGPEIDNNSWKPLEQQTYQVSNLTQTML